MTAVSTATSVDAIPPLDHDEAMTLAEAEITRVLALVDDLHTDEWRRPTDCTAGQCATCSATCSE